MDGRNQQRVTEMEENGSRYAWSPNGQRFLYISGRVTGEDRRLFVVNRDGTGKTNPTTLSIDRDTLPQWSPDGRYIAFTRSLGNSTAELYIVSVDGSTVRQLTDRGAAIWYHYWSPDSRSIVYMPYENLTGHLYVVDIETGNTNAITDTARKQINSNPLWSPNDTSIAYTGGGSIFTVKPDGSDRVQRTRGTALRYLLPGLLTENKLYMLTFEIVTIIISFSSTSLQTQRLS